MGEMVLVHIDRIIAARKKIYERYRELLQAVPGIKLVPPIAADVAYNYAYVPIEVEGKEFGIGRDQLYEEMKRFNVFTRRYFYPLLVDFPCYRAVSVNDPLTVARRVADRILTLPIYDALELPQVEAICEMIAHVQKGKSSLAHRKQEQMGPAGESLSLG
jgi:dTDP-4-amino-4,6-dideoxygalactose transaminase